MYRWISLGYGYIITNAWWEKYGVPYCSYNWPSQSTENHEDAASVVHAMHKNVKQDCDFIITVARSTTSKNNFPWETASKQVLSREYPTNKVLCGYDKLLIQVHCPQSVVLDIRNLGNCYPMWHQLTPYTMYMYTKYDSTTKSQVFFTLKNVCKN